MSVAPIQNLSTRHVLCSDGWVWRRSELKCHIPSAASKATNRLTTSPKKSSAKLLRTSPSSSEGYRLAKRRLRCDGTGSSAAQDLGSNST